MARQIRWESELRGSQTMADDSAPPTASAARWTNWSANLACEPNKVAEPLDEQALRDALLQGPGPVRIVGAGHSFTPLVATEGTIISLDRLATPTAEEGESRIVRQIDLRNSTAWIPGRRAAARHLSSPGGGGAGLSQSRRYQRAVAGRRGGNGDPWNRRSASVSGGGNSRRAPYDGGWRDF